MVLAVLGMVLLVLGIVLVVLGMVLLVLGMVLTVLRMGSGGPGSPVKLLYRSCIAPVELM